MFFSKSSESISLRSKIPEGVTTYDLLKTFAVIMMVIDHIGYYFYPDELWWRVGGRLCVPVWFFLVGYARTRDLSPPIWVGGGILALLSLVAGGNLIPLNILFTIIVIRMCIDQVMNRALSSRKVFWGLATFLIMMALPSWYVLEYGTVGVILAMFGYLVRRQNEDIRINDILLKQFFLFSFFTFVLIHQIVMWFSQIQFFTLAAGITAILLVLLCFKPITLPKIFPDFAAAFLKFCGHRTLEIYVIHLIIFRLAKMFFVS